MSMRSLRRERPVTPTQTLRSPGLEHLGNRSGLCFFINIIHILYNSYNSAVFSTGNHHTHLIPEYFHRPPAPARNSMPSSGHSPPHLPLTTTNVLSISMDLPVGDSSYKWNHSRCSLWQLVPFIGRVFEVHPSISSMNRYFILFMAV